MKKMIHYRYGLVEETFLYFGKSRSAYGIAVYGENTPDEGAISMITISDVSSDRERMGAFIDDCNRLQLSPEHLYDALEDFLTP